MRYRQQLVELPAEFSWLSGRVRYLHQPSQKELAGSCPECGGEMHKDGSYPDRFRIFLDDRLRAWCRRCGLVLFPDSNQENWKPDPQRMREWQEERQRQYEQHRAMADRALRVLESERKWLEWHENMSESAIRMWENIGIPRSWQGFWKLGYVEEKQYDYGGNRYVSPALTIPKFHFSWLLRNIDFRLMNPVDLSNRYRPLPDIPASFFVSTPNEERVRDEVFIVEGSKKAMITALRTGKDLKQVFGIPSKNSWAEVDDVVRDCGRVWIILDPDATDWANKLATSIGKNARIVELPSKVDDAILRYGLSPDHFQNALRLAVKPRLETT